MLCHVLFTDATTVKDWTGTCNVTADLLRDKSRAGTATVLDLSVDDLLCQGMGKGGRHLDHSVGAEPKVLLGLLLALLRDFGDASGACGARGLAIATSRR